MADVEIQELHRAPALVLFRALRLVESLHAAGDHDTAGRFYTETGARTHGAGSMIDEKIVLTAAGVAGAASVLDERWDDAIRQSLETALSLAGPEIGSPVLHVERVTRGSTVRS